VDNKLTAIFDVLEIKYLSSHLGCSPNWTSASPSSGRPKTPS
jgi:hypothetical protein